MLLPSHLTPRSEWTSCCRTPSHGHHNTVGEHTDRPASGLMSFLCGTSFPESGCRLAEPAMHVACRNLPNPARSQNKKCVFHSCPDFEECWEKVLWNNSVGLLTPGSPCGSAGKESACNAGDLGSIPGLGRSPGEGKGYPLQYSGLESSRDCIVHGAAKSQTWMTDFHFTSLHFFSLPWSCHSASPYQTFCCLLSCNLGGNLESNLKGASGAATFVSIAQFSTKKTKFWLGHNHNNLCITQAFKNTTFRASLVAQWSRIRLPMQETLAWSLNQEDPMPRGN